MKCFTCAGLRVSLAPVLGTVWAFIAWGHCCSSHWFCPSETCLHPPLQLPIPAPVPLMLGCGMPLGTCSACIQKHPGNVGEAVSPGKPLTCGGQGLMVKVGSFFPEVGVGQGWWFQHISSSASGGPMRLSRPCLRCPNTP